MNAVPTTTDVEGVPVMVGARLVPVGAGSTNDFTIDFDLRKSVVHPPGQGETYLLKPVLRLVNNLEVGTIDGTVAAALLWSGRQAWMAGM